MIQPCPMIRSSLLAEFSALVGELGGPLDTILQEAGLGLEQIEQATLLIPFDKQIRLLQFAADYCQCETFALELSRRQTMAVFGAVGIVAQQSATVEQGLKLFGRHLHYSVQAVEVHLRRERELAFLTVDSPFDEAARSYQFWDHAVALLVGVARMVIADSWSPRSVFLRRPEPLSGAERYSRHFHAPVAFDSQFSGLVFPAEVLEHTVNSALSTVPQQLRRYLGNRFCGDFLEQVRRVIISLLSTGDCCASAVAHCIGLSARSLQRKLQFLQTSFQQQLDRVRSELAVSYLRETGFSLTDIGELLGFAESSVFSRSFRRWFGLSPSEWRRRMVLSPP